MRAQIQQDIARTGKPLRLVKTHSYPGPAFGHLQINMDVTAGAIYIMCNPLDVAISFASHCGEAVDQTIEVMAKPGTSSMMRTDRVFEWTADWSSHVESWTARPHEQLCVLRYEDMPDKPMETFSRVTAFLKINLEPGQIEHAIEASSFNRLRQLEQENGFEEKPSGAEAFFRSGRKDQWREVLGKKQTKSITDRHREQMERFGYA